VHDAQAKLQTSLPTPKVTIDEAPVEKPDPVSVESVSPLLSAYIILQTIKAQVVGGKGNDLSQKVAEGNSVREGDLDSAIRSMRQGTKRRARPARPLSKIFFDGSSGRPHSQTF
jgi:diaphanous 1